MTTSDDILGPAVYLFGILQRVAEMRVADKVLKCTVFLGQEKDGVFTPKTTGFLVSQKAEIGVLLYIVTCAHSVQGRDLSPRFNRASGGTKVMKPVPANRWFYHPESNERFVDVAVAPMGFPVQFLDAAYIPIEDFCTPQFVEDRDVGVGDELFFPSLFGYHSGQGRNLPVMRFGTLAGMPIEPIQNRETGPYNGYLVEARSINGHSGSPVFVNFLAPRNYYADKKVVVPHPKEAQAYKLLGMIRAMLKADDVGEYLTTEPAPKENLWVNTGISTVVPAQEIYETIMQEDIQREAKEAVMRAKQAGAEEPTSIPKREEAEVGGNR